MQLARNLWLSADRSLLRKAKEVILARRLEDAFPKKRILTLYLNVAEWGDGVYGIEAAARAHFGVPARQLTVAQGAILAAMLPAPLRWTPDRHPPVLRQRALRIIGLLEQYGKAGADQAELARGEIQAMFGEPRQPTNEADDQNPEDER
jgi:monofunctional biosynthetic peptidoglycan transglycosylase